MNTLLTFLVMIFSWIILIMLFILGCWLAHRMSSPAKLFAIGCFLAAFGAMLCHEDYELTTSHIPFLVVKGAPVSPVQFRAAGITSIILAIYACWCSFTTSSRHR